MSFTGSYSVNFC